MREVWVNGQRFRSYHAFFKAIGVEPKRIRHMQDVLADAIKQGTPFWCGAKSYEVSALPSTSRKIKKPAPRPCAYADSEYEAPRHGGLLARGYSTFGLHQDKGDHLK